MQPTRKVSARGHGPTLLDTQTYVADKRMRSFKQKYSASSNSLCKLFI